MNGLRTTLVVLAALLAAVSPAFAQAPPGPDCRGINATDARGDAASPNVDATDAFLTVSGSEVLLNLRVDDLDLTVPSGYTAMGYSARWTADGVTWVLTIWIDRSSSGRPLSTARSRMKNVDLTPEFFTGDEGVVRVELPDTRSDGDITLTDVRTHLDPNGGGHEQPDADYHVADRLPGRVQSLTCPPPGPPAEQKPAPSDGSTGTAPAATPAAQEPPASQTSATPRSPAPQLLVRAKAGRRSVRLTGSAGRTRSGRVVVVDARTGRVVARAAVRGGSYAVGVRRRSRSQRLVVRLLSARGRVVLSSRVVRIAGSALPTAA